MKLEYIVVVVMPEDKNEGKEASQCVAIENIEKHFLECKRETYKEYAAHVSVKEAFEWRKWFDILRSTLGCPIRKEEIEKAWEELP